MNVETVDIDAVHPAPYNPRKIDPVVMDRLRKNIEEFGLVQPVVANKRTGNIVGGHQRHAVEQARGSETIDVVWVDLDDAKEKALNLGLNRLSGTWDIDALNVILDELSQEADLDFDLTGFENFDPSDLGDLSVPDMPDFTGGEFDSGAGSPGAGSGSEPPDPGYDPTEGTSERDGTIMDKDTPSNAGSLVERFGVPPFTVLDAKQGYWQDRKRAWVDFGVKGEMGRQDQGVGKVFNLTDGTMKNTSVFDPVLCECVYRWFNRPGGHILDPFAGEATKGIIAATIGYPYTGVELREEQVEVNRAMWAKVKPKAEGIPGYNGDDPFWALGDSSKLNEALPEGAEYDLVFTSPPYYDLEVYSEKDEDGSAFDTYEKFIAWYKDIFAQAIDRLKDNSFLVVKVGEIRDKKTGAYRNFVGDNIRIFMELGLHYYNEAILVTPYGTASLRSGQFAKGRKLVKTHQNVLVFYKGDPKEARSEFTGDTGFVEIPGEENTGEGDTEAR